jgi:Mn-dependent DtxR family transcriptional regulator
MAKPQATATTTAPVAVALESPPAQSPPLEEAVYNYLHLADGARLIEIESELGINRFQAVDALRSLMQKDLIIKEKDRTYHVQEEAVL